MEKLVEIKPLNVIHGQNLTVMNKLLDDMCGNIRVENESTTSSTTTTPTTTSPTTTFPKEKILEEAVNKLLSKTKLLDESFAKLFPVKNRGFGTSQHRLRPSTHTVNINIRVQEPPKHDLLNANVVANMHANTLPGLDCMRRHNNTTGQMGFTGPMGSPGASKAQIEVPSYLEGILGVWKGMLGANMANIRFEFTSFSKKLIAFYTLFTQPGLPFTDLSTPTSLDETISSTVRFNYNTGVLLIEDGVLGPMTAWVVNGTIVGKLADGQQVHLVKDS